MKNTNARERKFGGYFGEAGSFMAGCGAATWQAPCHEQQQHQERS